MAKSQPGLDSQGLAAAAVLKRAVDLDSESRYPQALVCYQEGIDLLLQVLKGERGAREGGLQRERQLPLCPGRGTSK